MPGLLALAAFSILVSLGDWQLRRLAWKEDLIARAAERPSMPPVALGGRELAGIADPASFLDGHEYRRAVIRGEYVPAAEVLVFTSLGEPRGPFGGPGYWVMTPFRTPPADLIVYVNRGFVPAEKAAGYAAAPEGDVSISGLIRAPERGSWFTPESDVERRVFYARDPEKIAAATGIAEEAGFFIDLDKSETPASGLPQAGETRMTFTNNHLQYAITWYGLAAALLAVFAAFVWRTFRASDEKPA